MVRYTNLERPVKKSCSILTGIAVLCKLLDKSCRCRVWPYNTKFTRVSDSGKIFEIFFNLARDLSILGICQTLGLCKQIATIEKVFKEC